MQSFSGRNPNAPIPKHAQDKLLIASIIKKYKDLLKVHDTKLKHKKMAGELPSIEGGQSLSKSSLVRFKSQKEILLQKSKIN